MKKTFYLLSFVFLLSLYAYGEEWKFSTGLSYGVEQEEWKDIGKSSYIFPVLSASYGNLSILSRRGLVSYSFNLDKGIKAYVGINIRNDSYNKSGNPLKKSNKSDAEIFNYYKSPKNEIVINGGVDFYRIISFDFSQQINEDRDVTKLNFNLAYPLYRNEQGLFISTRYTMEFFNKEYGERYYSIKTPTIEYNGDSGLNHNLSLALRYPINENLSVSYSANIKFLDDSIYNSPLVDRRYTYGSSLMLIYAFN